MNQFQENIQLWLSRKTPHWTQNQCCDIPLVLTSDVGLVREENQDRAAAIYTGKKSINPLFAVAVADGMGGMRDGGLCATLALSSFFYALVYHRSLSIRDRAAEAIAHANNQVFKMYGGHGGSTLTAVLIDASGQPLVVHLGDTRIYTFGMHGKAERQTVDDSLAEAVGGSGRELLQFVGMGDSMVPKIDELPADLWYCAITTDGIHGIEEKTLSSVLKHSPDIKQAADRLSAVSNWCGGSDNATSAIFDVRALSEVLTSYESNGIRMWDVEGSLTTLWLREEDQGFNHKSPRDIAGSDACEKMSEVSPPARNSDSHEMPKKSRPSSKGSKRKKAENGHHKNIELDIKIDNSEAQGDGGVDRK